MSQCSLLPQSDRMDIPATADVQARARVRDRLQNSPYNRLACSVRCDFHEGVVTLRGNLPSFFLKQMAQALARKVPGVEEIVNRIHVTGYEAKGNGFEAVRPAGARERSTSVPDPSEGC